TTSEEDTVMLYKRSSVLQKEDTSDKCIDLQKQVFYLNFISSRTGNRPMIYYVDYHGITLNGSRTFPYYGTEVYNRLTVPGASNGYSVFVEEYPSLIIEGRAIYYVRKFELLKTSSDYPFKSFLY